MRLPLPAIDDVEGARVDPDLPFVVDAHVHLFPERTSRSIWKWFDAHGWPIRHKLPARDAARFLLDRGVGHVVGLVYAHVPGMARGLNEFMAEVARDEPRITGLATVLPGEPGARQILVDAFDQGLAGVKIHCHVQCIAADAPELHEVYDLAASRGLPVVIHAGREPKSDALKCDPYVICSADRVERVLRDHPRLKLCVPHLGADEFSAYETLLERYDHLWLDTTMMLADYFAAVPPPRLLEVRPDRILYGTDFPNIPYAWDRELARIRRHGWNDATLAAILGDNARALYGIAPPK